MEGQKVKPRILLIPLGVERKKGRFDLSAAVIDAVKSGGEEFREGDIVAVSSKFISMSQRRYVNLSEVKVSEEAERLAEKLSMGRELAQLVLQEADEILGGVPGFALALKNGVIAPNAGIDKSNAPVGHVMLYSEDPFRDAEELKKQVLQDSGRHVGVVVTDSRLMPLRLGTTGLAVSVAGFEPLVDERGRRDLFGNVLKVTRRALADQIAASVQLLMGEADEGFPIVIVRALNGAPWRLTHKSMNAEHLAVAYDRCIYMRGVPRSKFDF